MSNSQTPPPHRAEPTRPCGTTQTDPHDPQLAGSVCVSVQPLPQRVCPVAQPPLVPPDEPPEAVPPVVAPPVVAPVAVPPVVAWLPPVVPRTVPPLVDAPVVCCAVAPEVVGWPASAYFGVAAVQHAHAP